MPSTSLFGFGFLSLMLMLHQGVVSIDYKAALSKSLLYYEAQRSGKLPPNQRVQWRADSGMNDGSDAGVDLVGGYYDAGDNVKFGFPMAFTLTMLAWGVVEFGQQLEAMNESSNALEAIRWGTDYLLKAHPQPNVLYGEVGDGDSDHECWQRPEDMTTPRTTYRLDENHPGSDLAGETSAAFAAAAIAFNQTDPAYSTLLLTHAKQLFDFGRFYLGKYHDSIPVAKKFYTSSGYDDELLWAAAWLQRANQDQTAMDYLDESGTTGDVRTMFSWDDKFVGVQILVAKLVLDGKVEETDNWALFKQHGEQFICNCLQKGNKNVQKTAGGLLWWGSPWAPLQYTTAATFIAATYSNYLAAAGSTLECQGGSVSPDELLALARSQVDYILGNNPRGMSYMVGFGLSHPQKVHHRGSSIVSIKNDSTPVTCKGGYEMWYLKDAPNPNLLIGAVVGGPDQSDNYDDSRSNYQQAEPATAFTAPLVGVLARLAF